MPRHSVTGRTDALPTALRGPSLYAAAAAGARVREVEVATTTSTAVVIGLIRWTATGTQGTALVEAPWDTNFADPDCTGFNTHTVDATAGAILRRSVLGAAIGSAVIWTFGESGIVIPEGTANGVGIYLPTGTGQHLDFTFVWDE